MRKVENTHCIMAMTLHKPLDPLCSILDGTHLCGALNASPPQFRARLIGKGRGSGHAGKVREVGRDNLLFAFATATLYLSNRHHLHLGPHTSH